MSVEENPRHSFNQLIPSVLGILDINDVKASVVFIKGNSKYAYIELRGDLKRIRAVGDMLGTMVESFKDKQKDNKPVYVDKNQFGHEHNVYVEIENLLPNAGRELASLAHEVRERDGFQTFKQCLDKISDLPNERQYAAKSRQILQLKPIVKLEDGEITYGFSLKTDDERIISAARKKPELAILPTRVSTLFEITSHNGANRQMLDIFDKLNVLAEIRPQKVSSLI